MLHKYSDEWTKICVNLGICLCNNQDNFHLHRFIISENIAKSFRGTTFLTHTVYLHALKTDILYSWCVKSVCDNIEISVRKCVKEPVPPGGICPGGQVS